MYTPRLEPKEKRTKNKYEYFVNSPRLAASDHQSIGATLQSTDDSTTTGQLFTVATTTGAVFCVSHNTHRLC